MQEPEEVSLKNEGRVKRCVPGHTGINGKSSDTVSVSTASLYMERWGHLFEKGDLKILTINGNSIEAKWDEDKERYIFPVDDIEKNQSDGNKNNEDHADKKLDPAYNLGSVHWQSLSSDIRNGEYDDRLEEIFENDDRASVQEAVEERIEELS